MSNQNQKCQTSINFGEGTAISVWLTKTDRYWAGMVTTGVVVMVADSSGMADVGG